ncbi:MAG: hypothetical protein IJY28_07295 [Clostridia bacterium]|nr:hypothetical protein [Clostridia bacterium]
MALSPFRLLAQEARARLRGHWPSALGILLLPAAILVLYGYLSGYLSFLCHKEWIAFLLGVPVFLLVLRPMSLGVLRWWAALAVGNDTGVGSVLYYFSPARYLPALKYTLRLLGNALLRLLPYILAVLSVTAFLCFRNHPVVMDILLHDPLTLTSQQLYHLTMLLTEVASLFGPLVFFLLLPLFFADYLYVTRPDPTPVRDSALLCRRCFSHVLSLTLRRFGWFFLSFFIFPLLYTLPYLGMTYAVFCKWMTRMTDK